MAGYTVEGADRLARTLREAADDLRDLTAANDDVAGLVARAGASLAPRLTGTLAQSLTGDSDADEAVVVSTLAYAGVIHNGSPRRGIAGRPFAQKGATTTQARWLPIYSRALADAIKKVRGT